MGNLGIANKLAGNLIEAQMITEKVIALCEEPSFTKGEKSLLANLATANIGLGNQEAARRYSQMAITAYEEAPKVFTKEEFPAVYPLIANSPGIPLEFHRGE